MRIKHLILIFVLLILPIITTLFLMNKERFLVDEVLLTADFKFDKASLMKRLEIEDGLYLWQYSKSRLVSILDDFYFIDDYTITRKYPATMSIDLKKRKPIARLAGRDGEVFFVDRRGAIFYSSRIKQQLPMIFIENQRLVVAGKKLGGRYKELLEFISELSVNHRVLYEQLSQMSALFDSSRMIYRLDFRTINKSITLKKKLNVENLVESLVVANVFNTIFDGKKALEDISSGYYYSNE